MLHALYLKLVWKRFLKSLYSVNEEEQWEVNVDAYLKLFVVRSGPSFGKSFVDGGPASKYLIEWLEGVHFKIPCKTAGGCTSCINILLIYWNK